MKNIFHPVKLIALVLCLSIPLLALCSWIVSHVDAEILSGKIIYFNGVFLAAIGWWYSLIGRAHDLKKYEVLSSLQEDQLHSSIHKTAAVIYGMIALNLGGVMVTTFYWLTSSLKELRLPLSFFSLYLLFVVFASLIFLPVIKNRIENANAKLIKRETEEKARVELIKTLKADLGKFEKAPQFETYNEVIHVKQDD